MTKRRRNTILAVLGLWAAALVLIAFGLFPQDFLRGYVELRLQEALGGPTRLRRLHVVPGKLRADFEGLEAHGPTYAVTVPSGSLVLAPAFLWGQSLSLVQLTADSPTLELRPAPAGTPPGKPLEETILIRDIKVTNGTVIYKTESAGTFVLRGVSMSGAVGQDALHAASLRGEWQRVTGSPVALGPTDIRMRISQRLDLILDSLDARVASSNVHVAGALGRAAALNVDLQVKAHLDLKDAALVADTPALAGLVDGDLHVTGPAERLHAEGTLASEHVVAAGWPIDHLSAAIAYAPEKTTAEIKASVLGGEVNGDAGTDGQRFTAHVRFSGLALDRLRAQGVAIPATMHGTAAGTVTAGGPLGGALEVDGRVDLTGSQDGMPLSARLDAKGSLAAGGRSVDLRYALDARVRDAQASGLPRWEEAHLVSHGTAKGALPPRVAGDYEGSVLVRTSGGPRPVPVRGRFDNHGDATSFTLDAQGFGGTVAASGSLQGRVARRLDLAVHTIDLAQVDPQVAGLVDLTLSASGPLDRLTGSGNAALHDLVVSGTRVGEVSASITGTGGRGQVTLAAPEMQLTGQGTVTAQQFDGQVTLAGTRLDALSAPTEGSEPLRGQAWGTVNVAFPFARPDLARAEGRLDRVEVAQGTLEARTSQPFTFTYALRRVTVRDLKAEGTGFTLQADGSAGLDPGARIEGRARFSADLSKVTPPAGWTATGTALGDVVVSGTRTAPRADGAVLVHDATVRDAKGATLQIADGRIVLEGDAARAENLRATVPGGFVEVTGRIPLAALLDDAKARAAGLTPGDSFAAHLHLDLDLAQVPNPSALALTGHAQGDVDLTGTRSRPRANGALRLTGVTIQGGVAPLVQIADGTIDLSGDSFTTPGLRATVGGGFVDLTGRVPLAALLAPEQAARFGFTGENADLRLAWEGVQAGAVLESLRPGRPSAVRALVAGDAHFTGNLEDWRAASGELHIVPTGVQVQDVDLTIDPIAASLIAGQVTTDGITVATDGGTFTAGGSADLNRRTMEVSGEGQIELAALSPFLEDASLTGTADVDVHASGPIGSPSPTGTVEIDDATLRLRDIRQPLSGIKALVVVEPGSVHLEQASAQLGGGTLNMEGDVDLDGLTPGEARVTVKGEGLGIRYPIGRSGRAAALLQELKARVSADLTLTGHPGDFLLTGTVSAERSLYDADINLEEGLLAPSIPPAEPQASRFLQSVALNLSVFTENPFLVRNNLAQLEAEGGLQLRGDMDQPAPFGRFEIRAGGKVFIQGRELTVESGHLIYAGSLDPDIAVRATTVVPQSDGDIAATIVAEGPLMSPRLTLTSDPPMSEREIASLIATGRANVALDSGAWIVGEQAGGLLAGRFTRQVSRQLQGLGLDQVDIQPELLAREGQPSARFTFGKQLTQQFKLVYSYSLSNPEARYYQGLFSFRPGREVSLKAQRREEGGYIYGVGQRLRFGHAPRRTRTVLATEEVQLTAVRPEGGLRELPDALKPVHAKAGKKVTYWDLLDDADRIRDTLVQDGYLEAVIDAKFDGDVAVFAGSIGPRHRWRVEGMPAPPSLDATMRSALFEEEGMEKSRDLLLQDLRKRGNLRGTVEVKSLHDEGFHTMVFVVQPGPLLAADVQFPGAVELSPAALLKASGGAAQILGRPQDAEEAVRTAYRAREYLAAKVGPTEVVERDGVVHISMPVVEGPEAKVVAIEWEGVSAAVTGLAKVADLPMDTRYDSLAVSAAVQRLRDHYLSLGYASVRVVPNVLTVGPDLHVRFVVHEGMASVVGPVEIVGLRRTRESVVRNLVDVKPGEPLDPRKLATLERRLRELGIFRRAVVTASQDTPAVIKVELEEEARYQASYDVRYNADEGMSALLDGEVDNVLGRGLTLGGRFRAGKTLRETRGSIHLPTIYKIGDVTGSIYQLREIVKTVRELAKDAPDDRDPLELPRREQGFSLQQSIHRLHPWDLLYGYSYKRTTCPIQGLPPVSRNRRGLFDPCDSTFLGPLGTTSAAPGATTRTIDVAGIDGSAVLERRDDPLNATHGSFLSFNLKVAPRLLGGDFDFLRELVQGVFLRNVKPSIVWAQGYRLGAIQTRGGQRLPYDDLFQAGGATTVRGFATDSLGPRTLARESIGGEALIVMNQELRYMNDASGIGGVLFYDMGNVFARLRDVNFQLKHTLGFGLRYDSPLGLLRVDLALPLNKREDDRAYQVYFGIGHSF